AVNTALANLAFVPAANNDQDTTIAVNIDDGDEDGSGPLTGTITLDVTPVNDAPSATNLTSISSYAEGTASVAITDIVVSDVDTGDLVTATLTLADTGAGSLTVNDGASYDADTGVWSITGTVAAVNTALANLAFLPATENNQDTTIAVSIDDGDEDGGGPLTGTITLDVTPVNDAPSATNLTSTSNYTEGAASVAITDIVVSDIDTGDVVTATLTLADTAAGSLTANDGASYDAGTGVWTITADTATVNTALANLAFLPAANNDQDTTIAVNIDDGDEDGSGPLTGTITLNVTPVNDAPSATNLTSISGYAKGAASVAIADIVVSDIDSDEMIIAMLTLADPSAGALSANDGASYDASTGVWTITGSVTAVNTALANLVFLPAVGNEGDTTLSVSIDDGDEDGSGKMTGTISLNVQPADTPVAAAPNVEQPTAPAAEAGTEEQDEPESDEADANDEGDANDEADANEETEGTVDDVLPTTVDATPAPVPAVLLPPASVFLLEVDLPELTAATVEASESDRREPEGARAVQPAVKISTALSLFGELPAPSSSNAFLRDLNDMREQLALENSDIGRIVVGGLGVSAGLSVGYLAWLVRSGVLLSSMLSTLPAWRFVDPLPVLSGVQGSADDEDTETLQSMVEDKAPPMDAADEEVAERLPPEASA
ncbi:MAG: Ig-like domain-containing protein, partial [Alphaproteobacteria bacterium]